jgi:hypothetical protein
VVLSEHGTVHIQHAFDDDDDDDDDDNTAFSM